MKVFGITGWKNSGKTGLVERLVRAFDAAGYSVATIKHAHHSFDIDHEGRDSDRHRKAGAGQVLVASDQRWALIREYKTPQTPDLDSLLARLDPCDLVLVEGFKDADIPKLECYRPDVVDPPRILESKTIEFLATAEPYPDFEGVQLALDDTDAIVAKIKEVLSLP